MSLFKNPKKEYFKHKLNGVQKMIWDLEFKREKTLVIREEVRREYDGCTAKLDATVKNINSQLKDPTVICEIHNPAEGTIAVHKDKGTCTCQHIEEGFIGVDELERIYDQKYNLINDCSRYIAQMQRMDVDVAGSPKCNEYPDGEDGINQQLEALRELQGMIKLYMQSL